MSALISAHAARWFRGPTFWVGYIIAAGLISVAFFDLGPPLAFNDDWVYAWSVKQLVGGHGIVLNPEASASALVQIVWGALFSLGHPDQRILRLSQLPFLVLAAWSVYRLARDAGADLWWSAVGAATLLCFPIFAALGTSFMTDGYFVALMLAALAQGGRWVISGKGRAWTVVLVGLATLERQHGVALVPALACALLVVWIGGRGRKSDIVYFIATAATAALALLGPGWVGWSSATITARSGGASMQLDNLLQAGYWAVGVVGLLLVPYLIAVIRLPLERRSSQGALAAVFLFVVGAWFVFGLAHRGLAILPGNYFTTWGLNPISLGGQKPQLFPFWLFLYVEVLAVVCAAALLGRSIEGIRIRTPSPLVVLLTVTAASQLVLLGLNSDIFDRYLLPIGAPLVPLAAAMASRSSGGRLARTWAMVALVAGLGIYVVGEQDHQAWQEARDKAAQLTYECYPADAVNAGFEANGVYIELPALERSGQSIGPGPTRSPALAGPADPSAVLLLSNDPNDPSPGVPYSSLAPGKVIIQVRHPSKIPGCYPGG